MTDTSSGKSQPSRNPLKPTSVLTLVNYRGLAILEPGKISVKRVGLKGYGLSCLPTVWTKPFFVVSGGRPPKESAFFDALNSLGIRLTDRVFIRSSGVNESIDHRGTLDSADCVASDALETLDRLKRNIEKGEGREGGVVHWVVQSCVHSSAKGHLSNERRLSKDLRDWVAEIEVSTTFPAEAHRIAIRPWRDAALRTEEELICRYRQNLTKVLEDVARWAYERKVRVHFEWVWDGRQLFVVQADSCDKVRKGVSPKALVKSQSVPVLSYGLSVFRTANDIDFNSYRKLANAALYRKIGYSMPDFYVLDNKYEIDLLLESGVCSPELNEDLERLTNRPLVIRTDGSHIPADKKQMLPRSDELRSADAARDWLVNTFRKKIADAGLGKSGLCLIAHHFIAATSSAWCQAHPDQRRVRIESIWGIPEGLYWYAYDVFDVDTQILRIQKEQSLPENMRIRERLRHKERFVAPDISGAWVVHHTSETADWARSISRKEWISEIAWTSRKIATELGCPVVVMWLIDIPSDVSKHRVLPWYHEQWHGEGAQFKAAPRKKFSRSTEHVVRSQNDWGRLLQILSEGEHVARVRVEPTEPELVRDQTFAESLGRAAKQYKFVVELAGGVLSHAYYMLTREGCDVECTDLDNYATEEDEVEFNKLVRDKIPEVIASRGEHVVLVELEGEALITALRRKLIEEAFEVLDAKSVGQITEELADLREVVLALTSRLEIPEEEIENVREEKLKSRGGFYKSLMLTRTVLTPPLKMPEEEGGLNDTDPSLLRVDKKISHISGLPFSLADVHIDKRRNSSGALERQFTFSLPAVADSFAPSKVSFSLDTPEGREHNMVLEITLERDAAELRSRLRLTNAPAQLQLDFFSDDGNGQ